MMVAGVALSVDSLFLTQASNPVAAITLPPA